MTITIVNSKMILREIEIKVAKRADEMMPQVIDAFFNKLKQNHIKSAHLNDCDCIYCNRLRVYTRAKIRLHRIKKRFDWEYIEIGYGLTELMSDAVFEASKQRELKNEAKEL
jgi:hypothetical protein